MVRYIDVDMDVSKYVTVWDCNCSEFGKQTVIAVDDLNYLPTADVAPRAEVDKAYWEGVEYGHKDGASLVAREIFEEIKDQLRGIFDFFRQDNDIRESCAIMFAISEVDKIEKKYTQPEPPKGD